MSTRRWYALAANPVEVAAGADVLVVEKARIVEPAAQRHTPIALISAGGSPSGAVQLLGLLDSWTAIATILAKGRRVFGSDRTPNSL
jgi:hypothetical protein